ncbi:MULTISPECIES: transcriptional repressor [Aliiglaciecola]|uniref:transcriptional repressor n=1 Tax=Aliiglaciecola TaxID=1406885 RepID=UPI001C084366|nr:MULTISPECIES: transcriptional repressor [Aliiglaciecola]MBU2879487.1 transcriptional repressor [Aliiglaciecola lipolytica]MDO6713340.1 transcriptional repressor [Aliiglaciecola sp. 2_MG-2023]MDO6753664.1 transcriptional repressor [Aliiglaciecola sp. 1_MG-2023]
MNIDAQLSRAKEYCEGKGARFTSLREKVYELLLNKSSSVGAYELLDELKVTESGAKPATVYRTLDFLLEFGLVHRLESTNAFVACHHFDCSHPVQFLICDKCGLVKEIQSEGLKETLDKQANSVGFKVSKQTIEAHGTCALCQ